MSYHFAKPSFPLCQYVKQYWALENCLPVGGNHTQRIIPNGLMELVFYIEGRPQSLDAGKHLEANSNISGQLRKYYDLELAGQLSMFSVSFQPQGAQMFFDVPSNELYDQNVPLQCLLKSKIEPLEEGLYEAKSFEDRICIIEKFLSEQLRRNAKGYEMDRMAKSIGLINRSKGLVSIEELSSAACLCRKQYERSFSAYIGSSPKQFLRTVRFQHSLHLKQQNRALSLTDLAYDCGYFDQSHLIKDYKALSGKTPSEYFKECEPCSDYFL